MVSALFPKTLVEVILGLLRKFDKLGRGDLAWLVYHIDGGIESFSIKRDVEWDVVASLAELPSDL